MCPIKRAIYQSKLDNFKQQDYPIVYMDESGFEAETIKPYGYVPIGSPCIDSYNWQVKKHTNVIGAIYEKLLNRHAHRILWLPPYSLDLNPIEKK